MDSRQNPLAENRSLTTIHRKRVCKEFISRYPPLNFDANLKTKRDMEVSTVDILVKEQI